MGLDAQNCVVTCLSVGVGFALLVCSEVPMSNGIVSPRDEERKVPLHDEESDLDQVRRAVKGIRFGEVRIIIQDRRIVQIDRLEKQRLR
ncbi:YezD family protein [Singulisphaera rosea]